MLDVNKSIEYCLDWLKEVGMYTDLEINWLEYHIDDCYVEAEHYKFAHQGIVNELCLAKTKIQVCLSLAQYSVPGVVIDITKTRERAEKRIERILYLMSRCSPSNDFIIG